MGGIDQSVTEIISMETAISSTAHRDTKAWEAGIKAGEEGKPPSKCPHVTGSIQAKSWHLGHSEGSARKKNSPGGHAPESR